MVRCRHDVRGPGQNAQRRVGIDRHDQRPDMQPLGHSISDKGGGIIADAQHLGGKAGTRPVPDQDKKRHAADVSVHIVGKHNGAETVRCAGDCRHGADRAAGLPNVGDLEAAARQNRRTRRDFARAGLQHETEYHRRRLQRIGERRIAIRQFAREIGDAASIGLGAEIAHKPDRREAVRLRQQHVEANDARLRFSDLAHQIRQDLAAPGPSAIARQTFAVDIDDDDRRCFRWRGQERQRTIEHHFTNVVAQVERAWRPQQQCRGETAAAKNGNRQWPRAKTHESSLSLSRLDDLRPYWWALFMETHDDATPAAVRPIQSGSSTKINAANLLQRPRESGRPR